MNALIHILLVAGILGGSSATSEPEPVPLEEPIRVLLLGDSISIGYTGEVRRLLGERAVVVRPMNASGKGAENCAGTNKGVEHLDRWLALDGGDWDVIHFNFGLHDLKRVDGETGKNSNDPDDPHQAPPARYEAQLRDIVARLRATGAPLVFATTTPVPEGDLRPYREPQDAVKYNAIARRVMAESGVRIDDLYAFALPRLAELQRPENVHFTAAGSRALAGEVVRSILASAGLLVAGAELCPERGTWSSEPARRWEDALVSGNGRMGVMVFGDPIEETIVANHCRLFLPLGSREIVPDLGASLPELRRIVGAGEDYEKGMAFLLGEAKAQGFPGIINTDPFHPGLFVHLRQPEAGEIREYSRSEDFATGEVAVRWTDDRGRWSRRTFVSRADNVIVTSLSGSAKVDCELLFPPLNPTAGESDGGWVPGVEADQLASHRTLAADSVTYHNVYTKGKGGFDSAVRVCVPGGEATVGEDGLTVRGADEILLLIRIVPWKTPLSSDRSEAWAYSPENPDFAAERLGRFVACPALADSSVVAYSKTDAARALTPELEASLLRLPAEYGALFERHVALHRPLFERVRLDLGASPERRGWSSERLLDEAERSGRLPLALAEKMHDAGRYMFLCCAGELPPNLQGIWTGTWKPAWSGDFTLDTNLQLAIKHGFSGNYPELMEGYFRLMESFFPEWRLNARRTYGADGFLTNARASNTALLLHWGRWPGIFWTAGCGWLVRPFYEHYLYTGDRRFLRTRTVPFLEEVAAFYEDFVLVDEATGKIEFRPSYSPETGACTSATMDVMVMRDVLTSLLDAYRALDLEAADPARWQALLAKLPDYRINADGALAEWIPEGRSERYRHRHLSHLHSAYEATGELGPDADPTLRAAAREAVRRRIDSGGEPSSHGRAHLGLAAAELDLPREAYGRIEVMATGRSMVPSLMCTHEPGGRIFNVDAGGAIPEIVHRLLLRARPGTIELLPALPEEWPAGEITGLLARGRITIVRLAWDVPARSVTCLLRSPIDQTVSIELPAYDPEGALTRSLALEAGQDATVTLRW